MFISIDTSTISKKEKRTRFFGNSRLNPSNRFSNRSKLKSSNTSRSQKRCENHVITRGYTNDIVDTRIQSFHESASGPTGAENHHSWLLVWFGGSKSRIVKRGGWTGCWSGEAREKSERWEEVRRVGGVGGFEKLFRGEEVTFWEVSKQRHG